MSDIAKIREALEFLEGTAVRHGFNTCGPTRTALAEAIPIAKRLEAALPTVVEALNRAHERLSAHPHNGYTLGLISEALSLLQAEKKI